MLRLPHRIALLIFAAFSLTGGSCDRYRERATAVDPAPPLSLPVDHSHASAAGSGLIATVGREQYHAEAIFEASGALSLYTLGRDATRVQEVPQQVLTAYLKPKDGSDSLVMVLRADPAPEDAKGKTSRFAGRLPERIVGKPCTVIVAGLEIAGERFVVRFGTHPRQAYPNVEKTAIPAT